VASYGFLGAVQGASDSISGSILMKMEEAKETRLAELRGSINRETNTQNNAQRNENSISQQAQRSSDAMALQEQGNQNSLSRMKQEDVNQTSQKQFDIDNEETYSSEYDGVGPENDGKGSRTGQVGYRSGQWSRAGNSVYGGGGGQEPSKIREIELLQSKFGLSQKDALSYSSGELSDNQLKEKLYIQYAGKMNAHGELYDAKQMAEDGLAAIRGVNPSSGRRVPSTYAEAVESVKAAYPNYDAATIDRFIADKLPNLKK